MNNNSPENKLPSLKVNAVLNSIRSVLGILFPLITYPYVTRLLQAENLGKVSFVSSTMSYFSLVAVLGLTNYAAREGIQYREDRKRLNQFCGELLTVNLVTTLLAYILLFAACLMIPSFRNYSGLFAIYSATILFSTLGMEWLYSLREDYLYITIQSIIMQVVSLVLMFALVRDQEDYYIYAAINVVAAVGGNVFNFFYSRRYIKPKLVFSKRVFGHLKSSVIFFCSSIASSIYSNIDMTMLGMLSGDYYVGIYAVSVKIYSMIKMVLSAVLTTTMPRMTYYRAKGMEAEFNSLLSIIIKTAITILLPVVVGINLVAGETIFVISGEGFAEAEAALRILSVAILVAMFASVVNGTLVACKMEKCALQGTVSAAITNCVTNLVAIPLFQQNGAAFTTMLSEGVVMLVGWHHVRKLVKLEEMGSVFMSSALGCLAMIPVCFLLELYITHTILLLIAKVILGAGIYFVVQYLLRNEIVVGEVRKILDRKH